MKQQQTHLLIFTRFPCAGKTKTRLIPALGAAGAAAFHDRLVRHTLKRVADFQDSSTQVKQVIYLDGASAAEGCAWLGAQNFRPQAAGDLGERLAHAVRDAFGDGATKVLVIGTDCPDLDASVLGQASDHLSHQPLVFGPAHDGGYYLVGLAQECPQIFQNIAWGSSTVLQQSLRAAEHAGLQAGLLPHLSDVDEPADLAAAEIALAKP